MSDMDNIYAKIGGIIRKERKSLILDKGQKKPGVSMDRLAEELGTTRQHVSQWENGYPIYDDSYLVHMSHIFDCDYAYLIGEQEERHRTETDIKAVTGLSAETITALADLNRLAHNSNKKKAQISQDKMDIINSFLHAILTGSGDILDNMYDNVRTLSRIKEIENSDVYKMSEAEVLQAQLEDPDRFKDFDGYEIELHDLRNIYKAIQFDLSVRIINEINKIELR